MALNIINSHFSGLEYENTLISSVSAEKNKNLHKFILIRKSSKIKSFWDTAKAKRYIDKTVKRGKCCFFISHTSGLLDNYVFFQLLEKFPTHSLNFFYDGVLYFYDYKEPKKKVHELRSKVGGLLGINYKFEPQIFPNQSSRIDSIYTVLPSFTLGPKEKMREVVIVSEDYVSKENTVLILGGKPSLLTNEEVKRIYAQMSSLITEIEGVTVYYKGHHADTSNNFFDVIGDSFDFIDITQKSPVEEVIGRYRPEKVFSYPSSALVNLKAMYGEQIEISSFYVQKKKAQIDYMIPIFSELDIKSNLI